MAADVWQFRESMVFATRDIDLSGFEVVAKDGSIGTVDEVSNDVRVNYLVVDTGDWLPGRQVMVPAGTVERVDPSARKVFLDRTKEDVRDAPEFDRKHKGSAKFQDALTGYYHGLYDVGL
jgi:hypothetical protein